MPSHVDFTAAYQETIAQWKTTLGQADQDPHAWQSVLKRIFTTLSHGQLSSRTAVNQPWRAGSDMPIAALLDSGANIQFQLPPGLDGYAFFNWIIAGSNTLSRVDELGFQKSPVYPRRFATHDVVPASEEDSTLADGSPKRMRERKLNPLQTLRYAHHSGTESRHFGMDIGFNDAQADGRNGHIYFHFLPATQTSWGALMISCETSAPGKKNRFGKEHDLRARSSKITLSGMPKPSVDGKLLIGNKTHQVASRYDCAAMTVDAGVLGALKEAEFSVDQLALPNTPTTPNPKPVPRLATPSIWQRLLNWVKSWFVAPQPPKTAHEPARPDFATLARTPVKQPEPVTKPADSYRKALGELRASSDGETDRVIVNPTTARDDERPLEAVASAALGMHHRDIFIPTEVHTFPGHPAHAFGQAVNALA